MIIAARVFIVTGPVYLIARKWGAGIGAHGFLFKTHRIEYEFIQFGLTGTITYYFTPVR